MKIETKFDYPKITLINPNDYCFWISYELNEDGYGEYVINDGFYLKTYHCGKTKKHIVIKDITKTVVEHKDELFATREEAEKKLKENMR